ncbi:MAG TPA: hypothetical protein VIG50_01890 [Vicinamibacteria bacterium]
MKPSREALARLAGVGPVTLADAPWVRLEHDAGHRAEILTLLGERVDGAGALASR